MDRQCVRGAAWACAALAAWAALAGPARADELVRAARELNGKYVAALEQLARWCDAQGLPEQAQKTRRWVGPRDPYKLYVFVLPQQAGPAAPPADAPPPVVEWHQRFQRLRSEQAAALYEMARRCVRVKRAALAYELALAAGREDPDHEAVRRIFGYQKFRGEWRTAYEARQLRAGSVWHDRFGWVPKAAVRRYEDGQRPGPKGWISAAEDAKLHRDINSGWEVETEHYAIRTNHSIEAGVALGVKLEQLHRVWQQLFVRYYATEAAVAALFDGRPRPAAESPRYSVVYFRDRADYNRSLRAAIPNIDISVGLYLDSMRRAYFFAGEDADDRTLYHEATHQLFHQSRPVGPNVGRKANFWIVEGIAMFMESLRPEGDFFVLGGADDVRMEAARVRLLRDKFYVPLADLSAYGMERVQKDPNIATLYSQMAGLTHFLIYHDDGRYRDALVAYLSAVYGGQDDPNLLAQLTGEGLAKLDEQYREFVEKQAQPAVKP